MPWSDHALQVGDYEPGLIEEYARHNGHADLLRQHIDGATGS
jgi:hypothetical protein